MRVTDDEIIFKTDCLTYSISLNDVKLTAFIDNRDGKNYLDSEKDQTFTYLTTAGGERVLPSGLTHKDGIMSVAYADDLFVDFKVTVRPGFIIFEVQTALTEAYDLLYFAMGNLTIDYETDDFAAFDYIMNFNTYSPFFPANCNVLYARCTYKFGSVGARAAVIGSPDEKFRAVMKSVNADIPLGDMPISKAGGPFALDAENRATLLYDSEYQKDLDAMGIYTLAENIDGVSTALTLSEGAGCLSTTTAFFLKNSLYMMIEIEIVKFSILPDGTLSVRRGQYGTTPAEHAAGTPVYHLTNYFNMFVPKVGSELYFHIARETARAYNEGGFGMIYLDAIDGLWSVRLATGEEWYYAAAFVNEILKYCETPPLLEYSNMASCLWYARSRMGALDFPTTGYRNFIRSHI